MDWIDNLELFKKELLEGFKWQVYVAKYLSSQGFEVEVPALQIRNSVSEIPDFKDEPDIVWNDKIFEVKSRKINFNTADDFPFNSIFVDTVKGWQDKKRKPDGYICISTSSKKMICLSSKTQPKWTIKEGWDTTRRIKDYFYKARKNLWVPIETMIEEMHSLTTES